MEKKREGRRFKCTHGVKQDIYLNNNSEEGNRLVCKGYVIPKVGTKLISRARN